MPKANVTLYTSDGEVVTEFVLGRSSKKAPFRLWSIIKCMSVLHIQDEEWPKGVEAEAALLLAFHSHDVLRTSEVAKLLSREVATVCRALHSLERKDWITHVSRGTWQIHKRFIHHGKWAWIYRHGKQQLNVMDSGQHGGDNS